MELMYTLKRSALLYGDTPAMIDSDGRWTYGELLERVQKTAGALQGLGVGAGDMVSNLMLNSHWYLELMFGAIWAGGILVPLNTRLATPELIFQMNDCKTKVLVVDDAFVPMLEAFEGKLDSVEHILYCGDGDVPPGCGSFRELQAQAGPVPDAGRGDDDLMGIFYTGGTTGRAKGVMISHDNAIANSVNGLIGLGYDHEDTYLHAAPMFHLADAGTTWIITMCGGCHAFIPAFAPEATLRAIQDYKVTRIILVPTMVNMVINHPSVNEYDLSSLKTIVYGASPIPIAVLEKAMGMIGCDFIQGYGMSESSQLVTLLPPEDHRHPADSPLRERLKSCGKAITLTEVEVRDDNDQEVPRGEAGEICFKGPNVMQGYLNMPDATAEALKDGWMHSGDIGYMDEHGYIYLVDRSKDMIVSGGENVYSVEVEAAIYTHPAVLEAAAIGIPHAEWGEAVHAVVVLKPGQTASEDEIIKHCKELIAGFKCPKSIDFHEGELPKSGAGKILKRDLREPYWEGEERHIH